MIKTLWQMFGYRPKIVAIKSTNTVDICGVCRSCSLTVLHPSLMRQSTLQARAKGGQQVATAYVRAPDAVMRHNVAVIMLVSQSMRLRCLSFATLGGVFYAKLLLFRVERNGASPSLIDPC